MFHHFDILHDIADMTWMSHLFCFHVIAILQGLRVQCAASI